MTWAWGGGDEYSYSMVESTQPADKGEIRGRIREERKELKRLAKLLPSDVIQAAEKEISKIYEENETYNNPPYDLWGSLTRALYDITNPLRDMEKCIKIENSLFSK